MSPEDIETQLTALVDSWISYGTWRRDFPVYRRQMLNSENHQGGKVELLERASGGLEGKRVLDLGCGAGGLSVALARKHTDLISCDLVYRCCLITRLRGLRHGLRCRITAGSAQALPFPADSFDVIACYDVVEHVRDPLATLQEVKRVMRESGLCVVNFHHKYTMRDPHFRMNFVNWLPVPLAEKWIERKGRAPRGDEGGHTAECGQRLSEMHYFTCRAFRALCREAGLQCEILPPDHDGKPLPFKHRLRPFQNQYAAVLRRDKVTG